MYLGLKIKSKLGAYFKKQYYFMTWIDFTTIRIALLPTTVVKSIHLKICSSNVPIRDNIYF